MCVSQYRLLYLVDQCEVCTVCENKWCYELIDTDGNFDTVEIIIALCKTELSKGGEASIFVILGETRKVQSYFNILLKY